MHALLPLCLLQLTAVDTAELGRAQPSAAMQHHIIVQQTGVRLCLPLQGITGGVRAAKAGHNVIMTPASHTYLDYRQSLRWEAHSDLSLPAFS